MDAIHHHFEITSLSRAHPICRCAPVFPLSFLTAQCGVQFSPRGMRPSCSLMTARHLDHNTMGYLQWRWGPNSAMTTSLVRDTKTTHCTLALQVHTRTHTRFTSMKAFLTDADRLLDA